MKTVDVRALQTQPQKRLEFLQEFVGFGEADWKAIQDSVQVLDSRLPALLDAIYEHLLSFDDTRRVFLGHDGKGEVDPRYIAMRKEHLTEWLLRLVSGEPEGLAAYLSEVGRRHTSLSGDAHRAVPPRYLVMLTAFIQVKVLDNLFDLLPDNPAEVRRLGLAWTRLLMLQLELFLKAVAPHWPRWDEG
jgi:hypothetical protein